MRVLEEEARARPIPGKATWSSPGWLKWQVEGELRRLVRLAEAPEDALWRAGWLAWEVRYWALAVCLVRIGQLYAALEQRQKPEQAQRLFRGALAHVWRQALRAEQVA